MEALSTKQQPADRLFHRQQNFMQSIGNDHQAQSRVLQQQISAGRPVTLQAESYSEAARFQPQKRRNIPQAQPAEQTMTTVQIPDNFESLESGSQ